MQIFNDKLLDKYFDPKLGLKSIDKFSKQHKLSKSQVQKIKSLEGFQIHKQPKRNKSLYHTITADAALSNIQVDLMDVINLHPVVNRKVCYLFNIIDVNSRFVWTFPITNKRATTTADALQSWLKYVTKNYKTIPKSLNSDDGLEFKGVFKKTVRSA